MKKTYTKPEAKKINFQYSKVLAVSGENYCDQGWTRMTVLIPWDDSCAKCYEKFIWVNSTDPV